MDIDCNIFPILDDPGKGHIGTHKTLMGQVIHDNDGETLRTAMATFWFQIIQYDNSFLEDPKGLALVSGAPTGNKDQQRSLEFFATAWNVMGGVDYLVEVTLAARANRRSRC